MARTALPRPLLFLLRAGVLLAVAATAVVAAQTEFPYAAGTDAAGRGRAVSDAAGRVLIESPEFPRGLWVDFADEAGQAVAGIQVDYEGRPDSLVVIWAADPSGLRQETLLWTRQRGPFLGLRLKSSESAELPAGLTSIDWQIDPSVQGLSGFDRLVGWEAVGALLRESWRGQDGRMVVRIDDSSIAADVSQAAAIERLVRYMQETHQPVIEPLAETPVFGAAVYQGRNLLSPGVFLRTSWFEDENFEAALREALPRQHKGLTRQAIASLTHLQIRERNIRSLAGVGHLTGLESLDLWQNQIVDVGPLDSLPNLKRLRMSWNQIVDVSPLASLSRLVELALGNNEIADVSPLASLTRLERLYLPDNQIVDLTPLAGLRGLEYLILWQNQVVDVGPLASLTNLETLDLNFNDIPDVSPLAALANLKGLYLSHSKIVDVSPLASLASLEGLNLIATDITDVTPLASLTRLKRLSLGSNEIVDVGPLAGLVNLRALGLNFNQIRDIRPLAANTDLEELKLGDNEIVDVAPLASLINLESLALYRNQIVDLGPLATLKELHSLSLYGNQIQDISPLVANTGLGEGDSVGLWDNPLSDQAINEQIPALQARGVTVHY